MRGLQVSHALACAEGLAGDRTFMLTETDGTFITARQNPQLVLFTPMALANGLHISAPDGQSAMANHADFSIDPQPTEVWGNHFTAYIAPEAINNWLSAYIGRPVQLRWTGVRSQRRVKRYPDIPLSFADGYPYLLLNEASFNDLQRRCPAGVKLTQFRPNLVVVDGEAYAEDSWLTLRIGEVTFEAVKPCSRCILTTVNVEQGRKHPAAEPLRTLQGYRSADNGDINFGINLLARNSGIIRVGDRVEILTEQPPPRYGAGRINETGDLPVTTTEKHSLTINYRGRQFTGNNREILLEQLEQQGIRLPYSCRAGLCGSCKVKLLAGEVTPLTAGAASEPGAILACSCLPKTDILLG